MGGLKRTLCGLAPVVRTVSYQTLHVLGDDIHGASLLLEAEKKEDAGLGPI
jgi:hypothetical protein